MDYEDTYRIVTHQTIEVDILDIASKTRLAVDTETTGLYPYGEDRLFSIAFSCDNIRWYFNFSDESTEDSDLIMNKDIILLLQGAVFNDPTRLYFMHNAKFDLAFLAKIGLLPFGRVHDTRSIFRLVNNEAFPKYSLENCARHIGLRKSNAVEEHINEHVLYSWVQIPGKEKRERKKYFEAVPLDIISKYAMIDAEITYHLGEWQLAQIAQTNVLAKKTLEKELTQIYDNELLLTKTVFDMERTGVLVNKDYCKESIKTETEKIAKIEAEFETLTGHKFQMSQKLFMEIFKDEELTYNEPTATGQRNASFSSEVLGQFNHPGARLIVAYREAKSKFDFFSGFLHHADERSCIHTSFNTDGTATGRFSSNNPNLQNLAKDTEETLKEAVVIRRAIIPRPGFLFAMFDYDQMEYRLMLDYAGSINLIRKVLGGLDVHQATADLAGISRSQAKTTNFAVLYGSGLQRLSETLGVLFKEAERIRDAIFAAAPEIASLIEDFRKQAETRGYIVNWFGRRYQFPNTKFSYKAINYLIQGGCADIVKIAMNRIAQFLQGKRSRLVLTIHDELVIETHTEELDLLPEIKKIMETVYPFKHLPLTVGVEHSRISLADKTEGFPS